MDSVKEFLSQAFDHAKLDWKKYVVIDKRYFRPTEVDLLLGDSSKAQRVLKWKPKVDFKQFLKDIQDTDVFFLASQICCRKVMNITAAGNKFTYSLFCYNLLYRSTFEMNQQPM